MKEFSLAIALLSDHMAKMLPDRHFFKNLKIFIIFFEVSEKFRVPEYFGLPSFDVCKSLWRHAEKNGPNLSFVLIIKFRLL